MKVVASTFAVAFATAELDEPKHYARGFVRQHRESNAAFEVATITEQMREDAPAALDWSEIGAVTPVKDQGRCGSCWAFSATEGIESGAFMASGDLPVLAPQQIVACDHDEPDGGGCGGGDLPGAFAYVEQAGGMTTEQDYPYEGRTGTCAWSGKKTVVVHDWKYAIKPCAESEQAEGGACDQQDEDGLKAALNTFGPLSVCVDASEWSGYDGSGVFSGTCSGAWKALDHCVQLVGYDTTASTPYWKVRNSWSASWGQEGYILLPMGENACGIADEATYVVASIATEQMTV